MYLHTSFKKLTWEKDRAATRYPEERAYVTRIMHNEIGTQELVFTQCAATGLLLPWIPGFLGFHAFGKGIGGLFRTAVVSTLTCAYASTVCPQTPNHEPRLII
jgi:hypothetical protein